MKSKVLKSAHTLTYEQNYACLKLFIAEETYNYACLILFIAEEFDEFQDGRRVVFSFSTLNLACGP